MTNKLCKTLGISSPIIQLPVHTLTNGKMIAAVSEAGALGILGINSGYNANADATSGASSSKGNEVGDRENYSILDTMTERNLMNEQIDSALENTFRSFGIEVPIVNDDPDQDPTALALVQLMRKRRLTIGLVETFGKTISNSWVKLFHENGIRILFAANDIAKAEVAIDKGIDVLICTSPDLTSFIKLDSDLPVVAGYNITDSEAVKNAFNAGADGVAISTLFASCQESPMNEEIKKQIFSSNKRDLATFQFPNKKVYSLKGAFPEKLEQLSNDQTNPEEIFKTAGKFQGLINGMAKDDLINGYTDLDPDIDSINSSLSAEKIVQKIISAIPKE
ncbi:MAG: nitronate monooxygenase [Candidatus Lactobacillus pullistercoris]|uniref:Nitronate monooxygenase n=1 Tax=Candidatus Lactobacillus pullistercoris TaxID=2838636 RepID=A0A9E2NTI2_9LACO|nr:nitronate monooxygenase [Candidatus Lactobacillus pullistercoris]